MTTDYDSPLEFKIKDELVLSKLGGINYQRMVEAYNDGFLLTE